jgi:hypothetical protein
VFVVLIERRSGETGMNCGSFLFVSYLSFPFPLYVIFSSVCTAARLRPGGPGLNFAASRPDSLWSAPSLLSSGYRE